jgi:hypothetical protein
MGRNVACGYLRLKEIAVEKLAEKLKRKRVLSFGI